MKKRVRVEDLQFGMYVAELDRPWTDTPFMFQGFVLEREEQLETLRKYCRSVLVDVERSRSAAENRPPLRPSGSRYTERVPVEQEIEQAQAIHADTEAVINRALGAVRAARTLDAGSVEEAVAGMTQSVLRNPDALLLFTRLREKDDYTVSHALDVAVYMVSFGRFLELSLEDITTLGYLGLMQDVGKIRIPDEILSKRDRLTPAEFEQAKQHVVHSAEILRSTPRMPARIAELALLHHERLDGSGYPRSLKGREIDMLGCIAGIADTFDALTATRPYAAPVSPSSALSMLYKWRGKLFDAELVEQFIRCIGIFPLGSVVELNSGEVGIVIAQNLEKRLQPRVMVIRDAAGNPLKPQKLLDLSRGLHVKPGELYRIRRTLEFSSAPVTAQSLFMS